MNVTITATKHGQEDVRIEEESEDLVDIFGWYIDVWRDLLEADSDPKSADLEMTDATYDRAEYNIHCEAELINLNFLWYVQAQLMYRGQFQMTSSRVVGDWIVQLTATTNSTP